MSSSAIQWALNQPVRPSEGKFILTLLADSADQEDFSRINLGRLAFLASQAEGQVLLNLEDLKDRGLIEFFVEQREDRTEISAQLHTGGRHEQRCFG